ncbi:MAG: sterol desaturase family protein, partial [Boseongicola sp. SB0662_bin_57]|nr:sterol desaturase family protein [Boseongicola sp. SB0662_bin_57]
MQDDTQRTNPGLPGWHHVPEVPIEVSPFFSLPLDPRRMLGWVVARWFRLAENSILTALALICWLWLQPSLEVTESLSWDWIGALLLRNLALMTIVAGGLHWFFYRAKLQGDRLKF